MGTSVYGSKYSVHNPILDVTKWLGRTSFKEFRDEITSRVIGQKAVEYILAFIYTYLSNVSLGRKNTENTLVAAPSGTGKTETYRAIRDYFSEHIPGLVVSCYSMTNMTENGYKGDDVHCLVQDLFPQSEKTCGKGFGIIFMDEFDKKLWPSYSTNGIDANKAVQNQLLTIIEGTEVWDKQKENKVDTNYTMFIGLGSFDMVRQKKKTESNVQHIAGFGAAKVTAVKNHYDEITLQDIIEAGGSFELLGRFSNIVNFHELEGKAIDRIIDKKLKEISRQNFCEIRLSGGMKKFLEGCANSEYGCRRFDCIIKTAMQDAKLKMLCKGYDPEYCTITITSEATATLRYRKRVAELPDSVQENIDLDYPDSDFIFDSDLILTDSESDPLAS